MTKLTIIILSLFISTAGNAQKTFVGKVMDTTAGAPVKNAVVAFLKPGDSILVNFSRTNDKGQFTVPVSADQEYILLVMHPTFADYVDNIKPGAENLGLLSLTPKSKLLEEVILKTGSPIRIKGDTTIYTADSFKVSANANVEELLKKLPGIQVDKNGEIKAMGQTVEKVLVDGEEFFGDDPGMAVKNLRADAVKEVQVFDKKSEQAEFTGIDDGNTKKTINLKLKEDKKKGYFGKMALSGGLQDKIDDRYNNNLMLNAFKGKRKFSGFILHGNTGQDGLSWQDNEKFGGESDNYTMSIDDEVGGMMFMYRGGGTDDEPYVSTENGFIRNLNSGIQYSNKWNDKNTFNFSPKYNSQVYDNTRTNLTQTFLPGDSSWIERATTLTHINRYNIKTSATYDMKLDSNNTLKISLRGNFYHTESEDLRVSETELVNKGLLNSATINTRLKYDKEAFSSTVLFKHKFRKARRTLSINGDWKRLNYDGENYLMSSTVIFNPVNFTQEKDQLRLTDKYTNTLTAKAVYTEPLSKKYAFELGHEISYIAGRNDQVTFNFSSSSGKYDVPVDSLTNDFDQAIVINKPSFKISFTDKKIKFNFGAGFGFTHFNLEDVTFRKNYVRNYTNFFPSASLNYTYKSNHNLRFNYMGNTTQPTLNQLQPLRNNDNDFNQYIGNPSLRPTFSHNINITNNGYDFIKDRWMYQSLNIRFSSNAITNNRVLVQGTGKTITQPINTDGNISIGLWSGIGFKLKKIDTRLNVHPSLNFSKFADVINNQVSQTKNFNSGIMINLEKSKDKKYEVSLSNDLDYNSNVSSINNTKTHFTTNTLKAEATFYIKKVWSITSDFSYFVRQKTFENDNNLNNKLWNARLQKTFYNNEFTAYIRVRDILNENIGITRNFYSNTYVEEQNDRLRRYWMIGFTWDFKNKAAKAK